MARPSRIISLGRDNIIRYAKAADFYDRNPGLQPVQEQLAACIAEYDKDVEVKGCACRADPNVLTPGLNALIALLMASKTDNVNVVQDFIKYVAKTDNPTNIGITIYYRALTGSNELVRYDLP